MQRYDSLRALDIVVDFFVFSHSLQDLRSCAVRSFDQHARKTAQYVPVIVAPKVFELAGFFWQL